jgi:hypothetical protein
MHVRFALLFAGLLVVAPAFAGSAREETQPYVGEIMPSFEVSPDENRVDTLVRDSEGFPVAFYLIFTSTEPYSGWSVPDAGELCGEAHASLVSGLGRHASSMHVQVVADSDACDSWRGIGPHQHAGLATARFS